MLASDTGQRMSALHSPLEYDVVFAVEACDGRTIMQQMISAAIVVIRQEMIARLPCRSQSLRSVSHWYRYRRILRWLSLIHI